MKKMLISIGTMVALALTACGEEPQQQGERICVNQETANQIDDEACERGDANARWFWVNSSSPIEIDLDDDHKKKTTKTTTKGSYVKPAGGSKRK
jgi:hypothetical protein